LAAACAELGDFEKAVEWQTLAGTFVASDQKVAEYESRLDLYRQGKPWRERVAVSNASNVEKK
jgi:serine/threonine-protein kinase